MEAKVRARLHAFLSAAYEVDGTLDTFIDDVMQAIGPELGPPSSGSVACITSSTEAASLPAVACITSSTEAASLPESSKLPRWDAWGSGSDDEKLQDEKWEMWEAKKEEGGEEEGGGEGFDEDDPWAAEPEKAIALPWLRMLRIKKTKFPDSPWREASSSSSGPSTALAGQYDARWHIDSMRPKTIAEPAPPRNSWPHPRIELSTTPRESLEDFLIAEEEPLPHDAAPTWEDPEHSP
jgi:hypothetical protein